MKKRLIVGVAAAALLAVGLVGGVVVAQEGEESDTDDSESKSLFERMAEVLNVDGVDAEDIESAYNQAKQDIQTEKLSAYLDKLVEDEVIDQDTADEYLEWYEDRPEGLPNFGSKRGFGGRGFSSFHKGGGKNGWMSWQSRGHFSFKSNEDNTDE